jgi:hypothetical protein
MLRGDDETGMVASQASQAVLQPAKALGAQHSRAADSGSAQVGGTSKAFSTSTLAMAPLQGWGRSSAVPGLPELARAIAKANVPMRL